MDNPKKKEDSKSSEGKEVGQDSNSASVIESGKEPACVAVGISVLTSGAAFFPFSALAAYGAYEACKRSFDLVAPKHILELATPRKK